MSPSKAVQVIPPPLVSTRVNTGAVRFGNDWTGLFIRGDEAFGFMLQIRQVVGILADHPDAEVSNALSLLSYYADMIDEQVIER
jgi:hypothetical protein